MPSVTYSVCPRGWVCQAVLAPGVKRTWAQPTADCSSGLRMPSMWTVPVNQSAGPVAVWPPLRVYSMGCLSLWVMVSGQAGAPPRGRCPAGGRTAAQWWCGVGCLRVAGLLEVVRQRAGLVGEQLGPGVVAGGGGVPVVDLQCD